MLEGFEQDKANTKVDCSRRQALRIGLAAFAGGLAARANAASGNPELLTGLLKAHEQKLDEDARYTQCALKAAEEGYAQVAALFRASVASAKVHSRSLASLIKEQGGTPKADGAKPTAASTKDNLAVAAKDASYEAETMYPNLIKEAQAENNGIAVRALSYAKAAVTEHVKLYNSALDHLEEWKVAGKTFSVCPVCGIATMGMSTEVCPICHTPKGMFTKIV